MARVPNKQVVEELKAGKPIGCRRLIEIYQDKLIGEAVGVFHVPRLDAEEVVSDVLLTVVQKIQGFEFKRTDGDFHLWVMTIFRNRVRTHFRRQAVHGILMESFEESRVEDDGVYSPIEKEVAGKIVRDYTNAASEDPNDPSVSEKLQVIADVLDRLETWERVLLRCRALDVSYEDIAKYTGKPVKHLKVYHGRVKKRFMKMIAHQYPELYKNDANAIKI
ncbi:MAG: RNA polymerase sigma factor [Bacteroidota bacterium]